MVKTEESVAKDPGYRFSKMTVVRELYDGHIRECHYKADINVHT